MKIEPIHSGTGEDRDSRDISQVTAEQFSARLASLDPTKQKALELQEIQLRVGPTTEGFHGSDYELKQYQQSFRAGDHEPKLRDIFIKELSRERSSGATLRLGYPLGASVAGSSSNIRGITLPAESAGLDLKRTTIDCVSRNHFQWRYGISTETDIFPQSIMNTIAPFANHKADFSYYSNMIPVSIRIEIAVICRLPDPSLSQRLRLIRHKGKDYPCRDLRLKLQVDILPTATNSFVFPRAGASEKYIRLGTFKFVNKGGPLCLEIDHDRTHLTVSNSQLFGNDNFDVKMGNRSVRKVGLGEMRVNEKSDDRVISITEGELHLGLGDMRN